MSHRGSRSSSPRHSIHAWSSVRCVVVVLFTRLLFLSFPLLFFQTFQTPSSAVHKKFMSKDLRDFRLGTVASNTQRDVRIWVNTMFILISLKTEIARSASGPKLQGLRAEDAKAKPYLELTILVTLTADHKVLSDNCESRNNHRYAVVVQDLATQWIQAYPCKNKTSQETQRSLQKFLEPERKPKAEFKSL